MSDFEQAYEQALRAYADLPTEEGLAVAYELGRRASNEADVNLLQLVGLHTRAARRVVLESPSPPLSSDRCAEFLMEVLPHFEMRLRGFKEANERLQQRNLELASAQQEALEASQAKSRFLSSMSHELRTPLNSIIGFTEVLLEGLSGPVNETQRAQLQLVASAGSHLLSLVNDLLDLGRIEAGRIDVYPETFDLDPLLRDVVSTVAPMAERKGLELRAAPATGVQLCTDRRMVGQVMLNLLTNSVKFTDRGKVDIRAVKSEEHVAIEVSDTGVGIPSEHMSRLFRPFERLAETAEGTGLGLFLSREFVERLGGRIEVRSEPGQGSLFTVRLPLTFGDAA